MKKKRNPFLSFIFILFIIYLFMYAMVKTGYYESRINRKTIITDRKIREFEKDIKEGKVIDVNKYYNDDVIDYSNIFSKAGQKVTSDVTVILNNVFKNSGKVLKKLFW